MELTNKKFKTLNRIVENKEDKVEEEKKPEAPAAPKMSPELFNLVWRGINKVIPGIFTDEELTHNNNIVLQEDGRYLVQKMPWGIAGIKMSKDGGIKNLPGRIKDNYILELSIPKIPINLYHEIISFFRSIMGKMNGAEAFCQVYWDIEEKRYFIHVPEQKVSVTAVKYERSEDYHVVNPKKYTLVFECHSHNNMPAFWSGTDDSDEKATRLYGVFGKLGNKEFEQKFRLVVNGLRQDLRVEQIFEIEEKEIVYIHNREWEDKVISLSHIRTELFGPCRSANGSDHLASEREKARDLADYFASERKKARERYQDYDIGEELDDVEVKLDDPYFVYDREEIENCLDMIVDATDSFENIEATMALIESLEFRLALNPLSEALDAYLGKN